MPIAAAAVGLPRRASTTLTWLPFGLDAAPALADPAVELVQVHARQPSFGGQVEHDAERVPERISSNARPTSSSGRRCEISRSSGSLPRR